MGCGAVCGGQSSATEGYRLADAQFMVLFKQVTPNQFLYPFAAIANFNRQRELYPHRIQLVLTDKLEQKLALPPGVMEKWKLILFGLDFNLPAYTNCLGYPQQAHPAADPLARPAPHEDPDSRLAAGEHSLEPVKILAHHFFGQIEKDIDRTFPEQNLNKQSFKLVLQRITNHFPVMGYTQGINFIVGYLLIIGYSQSDAFWLFVHLALNPRYMLLGLYQAEFPLMQVFLILFRNALKRADPEIYAFMYEGKQCHGFPDSMWVFKWFHTCYLVSFPFEMCHFVWDFIIAHGSIGLIKLAVSLTLHLKQQIMKFQQLSDLSQFFQNLKNIRTFNEMLNIRDVMKMAYEIRIAPEDFKQLRELKTQSGQPNFYAAYFLLKSQEQNKDQKTDDSQNQQLLKGQMHETNPQFFSEQVHTSLNILQRWYEKLAQQRISFFNSNRTKSRKSIVEPILQQPSIESIINVSSQKVDHIVELPSEPVPAKAPRTSLEYLTSSVEGMEKSVPKPQRRKQSGESAEGSPRQKSRNNIKSRYSKKVKKETSPIWNEDDDEQQENKDKMEIEDQFYYMPKDIRFKRKKMKNQPQDILSQYSQPHKQSDTWSIKPLSAHKSIQHGETIPATDQSRLAKVGNSVLSNMSVGNTSNRSSNSSRRTIQKENSLSNRQCRCPKNKTEENSINSYIEGPKKVPIIKKVDQVGFDHEQSADDLNNLRKRMNTYHDWMVSSQGPSADTGNNMAASNVRPPSQINSEIEIQAMHMFKKKNKGVGLPGKDIPIKHLENCQNITEREQSECQSRHEQTHVYGDEESSESFIIGNISQRRSQIYQVESVK